MLSNGNNCVFTFLKSDAKASRLPSRLAAKQPGGGGLSVAGRHGCKSQQVCAIGEKL